MSKHEQYAERLRETADWDSFLLAASGLPGPRANLELVQAVADTGTAERFQGWLTLSPEEAPTNSPEVFLPVCGIVGLGRLLAEGQYQYLGTVRTFASDPRWRIREAVAMALQRWGRADMERLLQEMEGWRQGRLLEQRAALAALCEPDLLRDQKHAEAVLHILDEITASLQREIARKNEAFQILRQALAYGWSVAVVALPETGKSLMEKWLACDHKDVQWIMRQNLKKKRLSRMDATWVHENS